MKTDFKQEIFDKVAKHLLTQKVQCINSETGKCSYFDPGTKMKCAAGCLIPDRDYSENFEGFPVGYFSNNEITKFFKDSGYSKDEIELISGLQELHDFYEPGIWKKRLKLIAKDHSLSSNSLKPLVTKVKSHENDKK